MVQLSVDALLTCPATIEPAPAPTELLKVTVTFLQIAVGRMVSPIVTIERQVDEFPLLSVTVRVTLFAPKLAQVNEVGVMDVVWIAQLSVDPLLT